MVIISATSISLFMHAGCSCLQVDAITWIPDISHWSQFTVSSLISIIIIINNISISSSWWHVRCWDANIQSRASVADQRRSVLPRRQRRTDDAVRNIQSHLVLFSNSRVTEGCLAAEDLLMFGDRNFCRGVAAAKHLHQACRVPQQGSGKHS